MSFVLRLVIPQRSLQASQKWCSLRVECPPVFKPRHSPKEGSVQVEACLLESAHLARDAYSADNGPIVQASLPTKNVQRTHMSMQAWPLLLT